MATAKTKRVSIEGLSMTQARRAATGKFGEGAIVSLVGNEYRPIDAIPTGAFLVDAALGVGGFPRGRFTELYGLESSGKSTLALAAAKQAQAKGLAVLYLDFEHTFDLTYAITCGVDVSDEKFILAQPDTLEQGLQLAEFFIEANSIGICIVDSLAAMETLKEYEADIGDTQVAVQARALAQAIKHLCAKNARSNVAFIFINHLKDIIGGFNPTGQIRRTTPGGKALKFYASCRVELKIIGSVKGRVEDVVTGANEQGTIAVKVQATVIKNKMGPPYRKAFFYLYSGRGLCDELTVKEVAEGRKKITTNGSRVILPWKDASGKAISLAGTDATVTWFREHPKEYRALRALCIKLVSPADLAVAPTPAQLAEAATDGLEGEVDEPIADAPQLVTPNGDGTYTARFGEPDDDADEFTDAEKAERQKIIDAGYDPDMAVVDISQL